MKLHNHVREDELDWPATLNFEQRVYKRFHSLLSYLCMLCSATFVLAVFLRNGNFLCTNLYQIINDAILTCLLHCSILFSSLLQGTVCANDGQEYLVNLFI